MLLYTCTRPFGTPSRHHYRRPARMFSVGFSYLFSFCLCTAQRVGWLSFRRSRSDLAVIFTLNGLTRARVLESSTRKNRSSATSLNLQCLVPQILYYYVHNTAVYMHNMRYRLLLLCTLVYACGVYSCIRGDEPAQSAHTKSSCISCMQLTASSLAAWRTRCSVQARLTGRFQPSACVGKKRAGRARVHPVIVSTVKS